MCWASLKELLETPAGKQVAAPASDKTGLRVQGRCCSSLGPSCPSGFRAEGLAKAAKPLNF